MTTPDAKRIADRYIARDGGETAEAPLTAAEAAWMTHAETVHVFLRRKGNLRRPGGMEALAAFERIGDAIAEGEKRARGKR